MLDRSKQLTQKLTSHDQVKQSNSVLIIAYIVVKFITSISTYHRSFPCVDHRGLHVSPATSYFPPVRFNDQETKISALQKPDEFFWGFEIIYPRDMPRRETVAKLAKEKLKKYTPNIHNHKRFQEGATLHLFLIFTHIEITINGLISDRCRFFSSIKWYLSNSVCGAL